jgi:hypothetical protein
LWRENGLKPWRKGTFKISKDPNFEEKVHDVVDLYLNPPEGDVVVSVDAKTGIQALDRTQPLLPIDFDKTEKRTHDYVRAGTTDLYAAIEIRTGKVITCLSATHATADFLRLLKRARSTLSSTIFPCTSPVTPTSGSPNRKGESYFISFRLVRHG